MGEAVTSYPSPLSLRTTAEGLKCCLKEKALISWVGEGTLAAARAGRPERAFCREPQNHAASVQGMGKEKCFQEAAVTGRAEGTPLAKARALWPRDRSWDMETSAHTATTSGLRVCMQHHQ